MFPELSRRHVLAGDCHEVMVRMSCADGKAYDIPIQNVSLRQIGSLQSSRMFSIELRSTDGSFSVHLPADKLAILMFEIGAALEQANRGSQ